MREDRRCWRPVLEHREAGSSIQIASLRRAAALLRSPALQIPSIVFLVLCFSYCVSRIVFLDATEERGASCWRKLSPRRLATDEYHYHIPATSQERDNSAMRSSALDACKLLISLIDGAPERIRTSDPQIRSLVLYPAELRARGAGCLAVAGPHFKRRLHKASITQCDDFSPGLTLGRRLATILAARLARRRDIGNAVGDRKFECRAHGAFN